MRKGSVLIPIISMIAAVAALLVVAAWTVTSPMFSWNEDEAVTTNITTNINTVVDPTAGWLTYTSTKYHFSFKYPTTWTLAEGKKSADEPLSSDHVSVTDPDGKDGAFTVFPQSAPVPYQDGEWTSVETQMTIRGQSVTVTTYTAKNRTTFAVTPTKRSVVKFAVMPDDWTTGSGLLLVNGTTDDATVLNQVLGTFTVGDETSAVNGNTNTSTGTPVDTTAGWATYTSAAYHFSFKYPTGWKVSEGAKTTPYKIDLYPTTSDGWSTPSAITFWVDTAYSVHCGDDTVTKKSEVVVGGIPATLYTDTDSVRTDCRNRTYVLDWTPTGWTPSNALPGREIQVMADSHGSYALQEQILGTVVFRDTQSVWKTVSDPVQGFSFAHPSSYTLAQAAEYTQIEHGNRASGPYYYVSVTVLTKDSGDKALYQWGKDGFPKSAAVEYHANPTKVKLGTKTFVHTDGDLGSSAVPEYLYFANDRLYQIYSYAGATMKPLHEQMIASFEFTTPNTSAKLFTSPTLGISFLYGKDFAVKEDGKKVYVYDPKNMKYTDGQWVEVFTKTASQTLAQAVKAEKLSGYNESDCFTKKSSYKKPVGWDLQEIGYPATTDTNLPFWANADKCPATYTTTNGVSYFAADPEHPTVYLYFSLGQYAIPGTSVTTPWEDTISIL